MSKKKSRKRLRKVGSLRQSRGFCGPATLKMVLRPFGIRKSEKKLAKLSGATRKHGVEAPGLVRAARKLGMRKSFFKDYATLGDIRKYLRRGVPVIVDWFSVNDGHYSVIAGMGKKKIRMLDPELGRKRKIKIKTFMRVWYDYKGDYPRSPKSFYVRRMVVVL